MDVKRRTFMKALGLTAAGTILPGCEAEVRHLVPYLLPDDEIVPGIANWYASTCGECQAGCGIIVRVMEGRAKKIEGNPDHPLNQGKLCAQGQAALQRLYNPDRIRGPLHRTPVGSKGAFTATSWDEGINRLAEKLRGVDGQVIMISRPLSGTLAELLSTFVRSVGGRLFFYDPDSELSLRAATQRAFGVRGIPHYDMARADYVLSFGAPLLEQWLSPVAFGIAFGHMRQGRPTRRGRFVQIEPRLSLTGANADRWVPIRPGTEGLLVLGIGQLLLTKGRTNLPKKEQAAFERFYGSMRLEEVATRTDIPLDQIKDMARTFAEAEHPLAIGGGPACAHTNAFSTHLAINGLNALAGNINSEGGVRWYPDAPFHERAEVEWLSERGISELAQATAAGHQRPVLLLYDCNPLFTLPSAIPIHQLFTSASFIASFSSCLDESTALADLILPDHSRLETWGDHVQDGSSPRRGASLIQPVVTPLYDTRALGETILDLTRRLHPDTDLPRTFAELLRKRWDGLATSRESPPPASRSRWEQDLQRGGWWPSHSTEQKLRMSFPPPTYEPAQFEGEATEFPLHFYPYPSQTLGQGRGANLPWLQELPDTLTSAIWGSWIEINPATARSYGIRQGDMVRVHSPHGSVDAPALHYPGIRPDVVAMPIGQGHTDYGRYASHRGANPLSILAPLFDTESGALA
ncbi:MAG: molybdopterin dinucleotide binding domain-containing protein, partial [Nitrospira sp.]